jgi:hypothetical protein
MNEDSQHNSDEKTGIGDELRLYVEKRIELFTLTITEQVSSIAAHTIQKMIGILLLAGAAFFAWFALGFFIGELLESNGLGFLIASLPLFLGGYLFFNRKSVTLTEKIQSEMIAKTMSSLEAGLNITKKEEASNESK